MRFVKHIRHRSDFGRIPILDVLVEQVAFKEHCLHVYHAASVPRAQVPVEAGASYMASSFVVKDVFLIIMVASVREHAFH